MNTRIPFRLAAVVLAVAATFALVETPSLRIAEASPRILDLPAVIHEEVDQLLRLRLHQRFPASQHDPVTRDDREGFQLREDLPGGSGAALVVLVVGDAVLARPLAIFHIANVG